MITNMVHLQSSREPPRAMTNLNIWPTANAHESARAICRCLSFPMQYLQSACCCSGGNLISEVPGLAGCRWIALHMVNA